MNAPPEPMPGAGLARGRTRWGSVLARLNAGERALAGREGLSAGWQIFLFGVAFILLVSRAPAFLMHPQFYAEDGAVWYADAYNLGWLHSLTLPDGGYLNSLQRLGAGVSLWVPFARAPLVMNVFGLLVQCLPVPVLLSARCRRWAPLTTRAVFAALYVAIPNAREIHAVLTNSQWHLGLVVALLVLSDAPRRWSGRIGDFIAFVVAGFSGPFCILLVPLALMFWWVRRQGWTLVQVCFMAVGVGTQAALLLAHPSARTQAPLGATTRLFVRLVGGIFANAMFGALPLSAVAPFPLLCFAVLGGFAVYAYCLRAAPVELKLFVVYCVLLLAAALHSPLGSGSVPLWRTMVGLHSVRYWFFPMLAFVWCAAWCSQHARARFFKVAGAGVLIFMSIGIVQDWRYPAFPDMHFAQGVETLREARPGEHVLLLLFPKGIRMELVKKGPRGADR